jgi:hypothetical protein
MATTNINTADFITGSGVSQTGNVIEITGGGGGGSLDDLTDVVITTPATGEVLTYDGSNWVNDTAPGGGVTDGDKGDITVSASGATWTIDNEAVTYAKIQDVAANSFLANATASPDTVQEIATNRIPLFASAITGTPTSSTVLFGDGRWNEPFKFTRKKALTIEADFYAVTTVPAVGLIGTAISNGTQVNITSDDAVNHPGIVAFRDSTSENGGFRHITDLGSIVLAGGEKSIITFQVKTVKNGVTVYMGFHDTSTVTAPIDCATLIITTDGTNATISARARANNTAVNSTSPYTAALNTWYTAIIEINTAATEASFGLYDDSETLLWSDTQTNIPTGSGRNTGWGVVATQNSNDAASDLIWLDYMRLEINRTLTR